MTDKPVRAQPAVLTPLRDVAAPEGFEPMALIDPFEAHMGPWFFKTDADGRQTYGFLVDDRHLNRQGICHGGSLMTFVDAFLSKLVWREIGGNAAVTLGMQVQFLKPAHLGDWVTCAPEIVQQGRSVLFTQAMFYVGAQAIFSATAQWKRVKSK